MFKADMTGHCSSGQNSEIKQCCHDGAHEHLDNWVQSSKRKKGLLNGLFLEPANLQNSEYSFGSCTSETLSGSALNSARSLWAPGWKKRRKIVTLIDDMTKTIFSLKNLCFA